MIQKYKSYKNSGVEWIGEIPSQWKISKVKYEGNIFGRIGYRGYTTNDIVSKGEGVITLSPSNITKDQKLNLNNSTYLSWVKYHESPEIKIFNGDIILVKTSSIGKTTIVKGIEEKLTLNPQLVVLKNIKQINEFLYYYFVSNSFQYQLEISKSGGVTPTISQETINSFDLTVPPIKEQLQIVEYLDTKTNQIDTLIEKTQKKIELLKEKRTSLINHVVTKGLNPDVKMKDSGVEWIGEIPSHWICIKIKYLGKIKSGDSIESSKIESDSGEYPVFGGNGLLGYYTEFNFHKPILIIGRVGEKCGNVHFTDKPIFVNDNSLVFEPNKKVKNLVYLFHSFTERDLNKLRNKNTQPLITGTLVKNEYIPFPPTDEQNEIVEYLDEQTQIIDTTITKEQKRIELLKEYRQSLISEVVTGKIKVTTNEQEVFRTTV